jgi:hypothetical protein
MKHDPKPPVVEAVAAGRAAAEAAAGSTVTVTATATVAAEAVAAGAAEIHARVAGSRPRIIAIVPGSLANLVGNTQLALFTTLAVRTRFHSRRLVWLRRNPRFRSAKKK